MDENQVIEILTGEQFGGNLWEKYGKRRIYFEAGSIAQVGGMDWGTYGTGNISSATFDGEKISNSEARRIFQALHTWSFKLWYDLDRGDFHSKGEITNTHALELKTRFVAAAQVAIG